MTISLRRKVILREQAAAAARAARTAEAVGRTGQVARSTVPVADVDVPVVDVASDATEAAAAIPVVQDEVAQAATDAYEAAVVVDEAAQAAAQAAQDAADALTTASGKNSRRRGQNEPDAPPGGWTQGDQWIVDNADGVPVEVRVWDGSGFVPDQVLADEVLVLGGGGTVRLKDGAVTADTIASNAITTSKLAADAIDGMTITGATIQGGTVKMTTPGQTTTFLQTQFDGIGGWVASRTDSTPLTSARLSTARALTGTKSMVLQPGQSAFYPLPDPIHAGGHILLVTYYVETTGTSANIFLRGGVAGMSGAPSALNEWVTRELRVSAPDETTGYIPCSVEIDFLDAYSAANAKLYIDSVKFQVGDPFAGTSVELRRDGGGVAELYAQGLSGRSMRVRDGKIELTSFSAPGNATIEQVTDGNLRFSGPAGLTFGRDGEMPNVYMRPINNDGFSIHSPGDLELLTIAPGKVAKLAGNRVEVVGSDVAILGNISIERDLFVRTTLTGLTWPGSGNGWEWTAPITVTFPAGKFSKAPYLGGVHAYYTGFLMFAMVLSVSATSFEVRILKYSAVARTSVGLEYSAHER